MIDSKLEKKENRAWPVTMVGVQAIFTEFRTLNPSPRVERSMKSLDVMEVAFFVSVVRRAVITNATVSFLGLQPSYRMFYYTHLIGDLLFCHFMTPIQPLKVV